MKYAIYQIIDCKLVFECEFESQEDAISYLQNDEFLNLKSDNERMYTILPVYTVKAWRIN